MQTVMKCAYCGVDKKWPQDFPISAFAECDKCAKINAKQNEMAFKYFVLSLIICVLLPALGYFFYFVVFN